MKRTPEQIADDEKHKRHTFMALCGFSGLFAAWEVWTIINKAFGDTFSAVLHALGTGQPFIPFMFSMLIGHLWGRNKWTLAACIVGFICGILFWWLTDGQEKEELDNAS